MTARSKAQVCGRSLAEIVGSNPTGGHGCLSVVCVLSGTGLCYELITHLEESHLLWCVVVCDLETPCMRRPWPTGGLYAKKKILENFCDSNMLIFNIILTKIYVSSQKFCSIGSMFFLKKQFST